MDIPPIVTAVAASTSSAAGLGWWLSGRFRKTENFHRELLSSHEKEDASRHEDNLERFRLISVALARLGYTNGNP
jgi:hypothetical protein